MLKPASYFIFVLLVTGPAAGWAHDQNGFVDPMYTPSSMEPEEQSEPPSETVRPSTVDLQPLPPPPSQKPLLDAKATVFKFPGHDWAQRTAADYGIPNYRMAVAPAWETKTPSPWTHLGKSYTQYSAFIIDHFGNNLLNGSHYFMNPKNDVCPKFRSLPRAQRIDFWVQFVAALTKPESSFNPKDRSREPKSAFSKPDPITGEQVHSEGLLQLSYQDMKSYPKECGGAFNWEHDSRIARDSDKKTIFDPMRNLYCGIGILNRIVGSRRNVFFDSNNYWAVLKPGGRYGKVTQIKNEVRSKTPYCR